MRVIQRGEQDYPSRLSGLPRMPRELYLLGTLPDPARPAVAIVGARHCTAYGRDAARRFGRILAMNGVEIISGMAYGIDAAGHEGALEGGGRTYAVLGCGADVCYPRQNRQLYEQILQRGGILSEYTPGTPAMPHHFPARNRIVSGLADIVLVVEARRRSGSLITVDCALEQGKTVYAVPGRIGDPLSEGCNALIAQGAGIAHTPEMILSELAIPAGSCDLMKPAQKRPLPEAMRDDPLLLSVYDALAHESRSIAEIVRITRRPPQQVSAALIRLCLIGYAREAARGHYGLPDLQV